MNTPQSSKKKDFILADKGIEQGPISVRLAKNEEEIKAAQSLRYHVFYEEQGASPLDDTMKSVKRDYDSFDEICDHLVVIDNREQTVDKQIVGNYRILRQEIADKNDGFYTENEFDISKIKENSNNIMELGRSCVAENYRTKPILQLLWQGLAEYMVHYDVDTFMGCASFQGTDPAEHAEAFSYLYHYHLASEDVLPVAYDNENYAEMNIIPKHAIDEKRAFTKLPPLIKGYLRVGSKIGSGAFIDRQWGSIDVCILFRLNEIQERYRKHYERKTATIFDISKEKK